MVTRLGNQTWLISSGSTPASTAEVNQVREAEPSQTESSLLDAAIELYGRFGTQAVSLNQIRRHAAVANEAAIRYYFRNKQGLLARSVERVASQFEPVLSQVASRLEATPAEQRSVREILMNFGLPFLGLHQQDPNSLNFLGWLIRGEGTYGQQLLAEYFGQTLLRFEALLAACMPHKPPELVHLHFYLAINNLIHGLGDMSLLLQMPALSEEAKNLSNRPDVLVNGFFDYVCTGVEFAALDDISNGHNMQG